MSVSSMAYFFSPDVAGAGVAAAGAAAVVAFGDRDLTCSMSATRFSSLTRPWKVGISGWNPLTTFACDVRIDSRR